MLLSRHARRLVALSVAIALSSTISARAASPTVEQALKLAPIQKDVDYDIPSAADAVKCTIKA